MTHPLLIVIEETSQRRGKFSAHLLDGRKLLSSSRQPLLDAARVLPAQGIPPETPLAMQHKGSATIAMTSTVGEAAKLTVEEEPGGPGSENGGHFLPVGPFVQAMNPMRG